MTKKRWLLVVGAVLVVAALVTVGILVGAKFGTVGEWISGLGALAAVAAAFVVQNRAHKREDERDQARLAEDLQRKRERAKSYAAANLRINTAFETNEGGDNPHASVGPGYWFVPVVTNKGIFPFYDFQLQLLLPHEDGPEELGVSRYYDIAPEHGRKFTELQPIKVADTKEVFGERRHSLIWESHFSYESIELIMDSGGTVYFFDELYVERKLEH